METSPETEVLQTQTVNGQKALDPAIQRISEGVTIPNNILASEVAVFIKTFMTENNRLPTVHELMLGIPGLTDDKVALLLREHEGPISLHEDQHGVESVALT